MLLMKAQTEALQSICFHSGDFVGAAHRVAKLNQKRSKTAHTTSSYANEMDAVTFLRQESLQIERLHAIGGRTAFFRGELHESYISPSS